jgi:predicted alpha-1,2-mannosidase
MIHVMVSGPRCVRAARSCSAALLIGAVVCGIMPLELRAQPLHSFVDPFIGSQGKGNVFVGAAYPYGMVKPGPDCDLGSNSGYVADQAKTVFGFSQTHVSGTGGGPKYGNVSIFPFMGDFTSIFQESLRADEQARAGYYGVTLEKWNIKVELTATAGAAFHRYSFGKQGRRGIKIDAGTFLGEEPIPNAREAQQFVGSEIRILSDTKVAGYSRIRGGWNNGSAYTVYFFAIFNHPFTASGTWKGNSILPTVPSQFDSGEKTGAFLYFDSPHADTIQIKIGVSFVSCTKAEYNVTRQIPGWDFSAILDLTCQKWEELFRRVEIDGTNDQKKMFYTALYHTMLMPVNKTGENPRWTSSAPYYDDFYTLWDTFRTSAPLLTLIDPVRQIEVINAMLDIYEREGYLPEGRSGDCNGRTQGGSNAEVVIADAYAKGLKGINYRLALDAMLKDALFPPGGNEEKEGRGGLVDYNCLGYVSNTYVRAGTRTVEYAYDDFCLSQVAKGLGRKEEYRRFLKQSDNWQHLWRDVEDHGARGFIMPKDASGRWIDSIECDIANGRRTYVRYTPLATEWPICVCWWCGFFYEGVSWEYSFFVPHDIPGLIKKCGGKKAFEARLDTFFDNGYYNVTNEPDFLTSCLYHWIGRPDRSSERTREIIVRNYSSSPSGIPGNDDSGAMSSWLAFHMMGFFPNAGQPYYLLTAPIVKRALIHLANGSSFEVVAHNLSDENTHIQSAALNGQPFNQAWIHHRDIMKGGTLVFEMGAHPSRWGSAVLPPADR